MKGAKKSRDWDRDQVTVRLTRARKENLMMLAAREGVSGGPTSAIDRAIDLASSPNPGDALLDQIAELRGELAESDAARELRDARLERAIAELSRGIQVLSEVLRELASDE